ncbi:ribonuclease P protein component [Mycoplasmopsis agassizii]|uniref:Ribonuclease P protein component n=1 Tax=Mycoplasmopsis agassizii TaxID=33922 RepID=A0A1W1X8N6_9BACT|nr:ribonuclease P protein component [Mycoplasmopsis agassizii]PAF54874.1 ribonuclease P protein component [Mycoplasmopsis agassizii]PAK21813.1 ribonuclease P protein component [Mycoplasmopsis agassizii]SMC20038.1 ribonuclease P protein component [Mycoplasmopsis agassizii]
MKRTFILKKNWEFQKIIDNKTQINNKNLVIYYKKATEFKVGISVPKKFANAVNRNYNKRVIKSILDGFNYQALNFTLVIITRKNFFNLSYEKKKHELIAMLERILSEQK